MKTKSLTDIDEVAIPLQINCLVRFMEPWKEHDCLYSEYQYRPSKGLEIIYLGTVPNKTGHCVVSVNGKITSKYHTSDFTMLTPDQV